MTETVDNPSQLQTLDEDTLEAPESRVASASAVRSRIGEMRHADRTRSNNRAVMQAIYDGVPPYSIKKLRSKGQADRTNVNWREAEGMVEAAKTPYYSLKFRQSRFATIKSSYGDNLDLQNKYSDIISNEFHCLLDQWNGHDFNTQLMQWQMCFYGIGIAMFTDTRSPFWEARKISEVLVPDETPADIEALGEAAAFRKLDPIKLYQMVSKAGADKVGWFPERAKKAIVKAAPQSMVTNWGQQWNEKYEASLRRGDVNWNAKNSRIPVADYIIKEFSGKITHCIVLDDGSTGDSTVEENDDGLIFQKKDRFECFSQVLQPFFFDIGMGEWHSIKGLGPKIRDFCEVSNRFTCSMIDGARLGSALLLKATSTTAMQGTQLIEISGANVVQPDFEVQQNRIAESLQGPLAVKRDLQNTLQSNIGSYRERPTNDDIEPTLGQAQLNARNQAMLSESAVDRYVKTDDRLLTEQVRRALKLGLELFKQRKNRDLLPGESYPSMTEGERLSFWFVQKCVNAGVPVEALDFDYIESVKATRGIGSGSPVAVDLSTRGMMELIPMMDERGRRATLRMRTAYLIGQGNVDEIFPPFDEEQAATNNASFATLENNALRQPNGEALVSFEQDHLIHFDVHFQDMAEDVQALQGGQAQPMAVLVHLHNFGPHTRVHLNNLAGDPTRKAQLAQREQAWLQMSKITDQLQQQIEESLKSQQANAQPQVDPALVAAMAKVNGELQIKRTKAVGDMQLKADKQAAMLRLKDLQTAHDIRLKNVVAASDQLQQQQQQTALPADQTQSSALATAA